MKFIVLAVGYLVIFFLDRFEESVEWAMFGAIVNIFLVLLWSLIWVIIFYVVGYEIPFTLIEVVKG